MQLVKGQIVDLDTSSLFDYDRGMDRLHIPLPEEMKDALRRQADRRGAPMSAIVRLAISEWLYTVGEPRYDWRADWGGVREPDSSGDNGHT